MCVARETLTYYMKPYSFTLCKQLRLAVDMSHMPQCVFAELVHLVSATAGVITNASWFCC